MYSNSQRPVWVLRRGSRLACLFASSTSALSRGFAIPVRLLNGAQQTGGTVSCNAGYVPQEQGSSDVEQNLRTYVLHQITLQFNKPSWVYTGRS